MKIQPKTLISTLPMGRGNRKPGAGTDVATLPEMGEQPLNPNLNSLAAELHQAALSGVFQYPRGILLGTRIFAGILLVASFVQLGMMGLTLMRQPGATVLSLLTLSMLGAVLGVVLAGVVSSFVFNLFTSLQVTPQGLGVSELFGWRRISWKDIGVLRVMELPVKGRYVVMVPFKKSARLGLPGPMLSLMPWLMAATQGGERGVLITSDLKNFDRLLQLIVSYLAQAAGQATPAIETLVDEDTTMPVAQLLFEPDAALTRLTRSSRASEDFYGVTVADTAPQISWSKIMPLQLVIALGPLLLLLADILRRNDVRPIVPMHFAWAAVLLVLGLVELPFVARVVQGVGDLMVGSGQYKRTLLAYLELQAPRAMLVFLAAAVVGAGLPPGVTQVLWFAGIVLTTFLVTRYVQKLYYLPLTPALLASLGTFIFQASLFAVYVGVR